MTSSTRDSQPQGPPAGPATKSDHGGVRRVPLPLGIAAWVLLVGCVAYGIWLYGAHRALLGQSLGAAPWVSIVLLVALAIGWELFASARKKAKAAAKEDDKKSEKAGASEGGDNAKKGKNEQPDLDKHPKATRVRLQTGTRMWLRTALLMAAFAGGVSYHHAGEFADGAAAHGDWFIAQSDEAPSGIRYRAAVAASELAQLLRRLEPETPTQRWIRELQPTLSDAQLAVDERESQAGRAIRPTSTWPHRISGHEAAGTVPAADTQDPTALGHYFRDNSAGGFDTVHAIHSWIATEIVFDLDAHAGGEVLPQDPVSVLSHKRAIGPGFAALFVAVGEAAGLDVRYVSGVARDHADAFVGSAHAWNAVGLEDGWMLVDAARDARDLENERLLREGEVAPPDERVARYANDEDLRFAAYRPFYLGAPSEVFAVTHYPDDATWQLAFPQWRLPFTQTPVTRPRFYSQGLVLAEGTRAQGTSGRDIVIEIENPQLLRMRATITALADGYEIPCTARGRHLLTVRCSAGRSGLHRVDLKTSAGLLRDGEFVGAVRMWVQ